MPNYGREGSASQRKSAHAVLYEYLEAREHGNWQAACSLLAANVRRHLGNLMKTPSGGPAECQQVLEAIAASAPSQVANPLIGGLAAFRVGPRYAFALFYGPSHRKYAETMLREHGRWKVVQVSPSPYPPGSAPPGG